jgi:tripartite-type tricarboxylate transporter receptor subunit TctC
MTRFRDNSGVAFINSVRSTDSFRFAHAEIKFPYLIVAVLLLATSAVAARAQTTVADFYKGKTITITVGGSAGGGYDTDARVVARNLGRFIPGNPALVVQNVPGARGLTNANRLYTTAKKDGTAMAVLQRGLLTAPWLNPQGVQYDVFKFNWLVSTAAEPGVAIVWHTTPQSSIEDVRKSEVIIGGAGDSAIVPQVFNYTMGTKFKLVTGYPGTADIVLAMQRGEVQGIGYYSWSNIPAKNPDWISEKKIKILAQTGSARLPDLPNVPLVSEFALDLVKLQVQELWLAPLETARPYAMPPETPGDRVEAVRKAFTEMLKGAEFQADAKKSGMAVDPRSAEYIQSLLARLGSTPPAVIEEARKAVVETGE